MSIIVYFWGVNLQPMMWNFCYVIQPVCVKTAPPGTELYTTPCKCMHQQYTSSVFHIYSSFVGFWSGPRSVHVRRWSMSLQWLDMQSLSSSPQYCVQTEQLHCSADEESNGHTPGSYGGLQIRCSCWVVWDWPQIRQVLGMHGVHKVLPPLLLKR